jgi:hypothetical protein
MTNIESINMSFTGIVNEATFRNVIASSIIANSVNATVITDSITQCFPNGKNNYQLKLYTATTYAGAPSGQTNWLYTAPKYTPVAPGSLDPNFFVFPTGATILGMAAMSSKSTADISHISCGVYSNNVSSFTKIMSNVLHDTMNLPLGAVCGSMSYGNQGIPSATIGSAGAKLCTTVVTNPYTGGNTGIFLINSNPTIVAEFVCVLINYIV